MNRVFPVNRQKFIEDFNERARKYFFGLSFKEDTHEYFVDNRKVPTSVSGVVKSFVIPTDFAAIAKAIDRRDNLPPGTTAAIWQKKNNKACLDGSDTHDYAENYEEKNLIADTKKKEAVNRFWEDLEQKFPGRYFIVAKECRMYHWRYDFSGTDDTTLFDTWTNTLVISDYKTNEDLFKNHAGNLLDEPFDTFLDCPFNHYQIQLNLYQILLCQLEYRISERWIIWLLPDGTFKKYDVIDLTPILVEYLEAKVNAE